MRRVTATAALAVATTLVSVLIVLWDKTAYAAYFAGFIPARVSGALDLSDALPVWLTPLSATFVHAGWLHLGFNLLMLAYVGNETERAVGKGGIALLYVVGAYVAAAAQWLGGPSSQMPMIGSSGAVSALLGAYAVLFGRSRARAIGPIPAQVVHVVWLAAAWAGINLLIGLLSANAGMPIAAGAHIGGFVAGLALARPLLLWRWRRA
jgi:membrane associated rhomboid family serine protease